MKTRTAKQRRALERYQRTGSTKKSHGFTYRPKPKRNQSVPQRIRFNSYAEYLASNWWKARRRAKLESTGFTCERCPNRATQVHHKHYKTLGREKNEDLESLCGACHEHEHQSLIASRSHLDSIQSE